jgi:hypothetical protein
MGDVRAALENTFQRRQLMHGDVAWRNIGQFEKDGKRTIVIYDLETIRPAEEGWIEKAMAKLFKSPEEE